jgi:DNA-binding MarR family transcriptional regulator
MAAMTSTASSRAEVAAELREAVAAFSAAQRRMRSRDARGGGMSFAQWHLLRRLAECDELPAGKLAAEADLTPASVTQMLDHLAELSLVERVRSDTDRRVVLNRLTPAGREHFERKQAQIEKRWRDALSDLSSAQLGQAAQVLRRMADVLDSF